MGTSAGQSFSYDEFNRMIRAVGNTVSYTYNGDGLKVQRAGPDGTTKYYYDGIRPIWETDGAGAMTAQLDRDIFGNLLSRAEPTNRRYYHTDGLGSTVALTGETGSVAASMLYDAWGNVRVSTGTGHGKYRFTGAELDTTSNLYHMGARFYDPSIGRWLSEDPVQSPFEPMSLNFYAYVANNPLLLVDPTGTGTDGPGAGSCDAACQDAARKEDIAREVWGRLDSIGIRADLDTIIDALDLAEGAAIRYVDVNVGGATSVWGVLSVGFTGGVILTTSGKFHPYFGVMISTPGFSGTVTISTQDVTTGWNVAVTAVIRGGSKNSKSGGAVQVGTVLGCFSTCGYREYGVGTPGFAIMEFYVW